MSDGYTCVGALRVICTEHHCPVCDKHPKGGYMYCRDCEAKAEHAAREMTPKITEVRFTEEKRLFGSTIHVAFVLDNEELVQPFKYYPDELSFTAEEFIGGTVDEAIALFHAKDMAYLRS